MDSVFDLYPRLLHCGIHRDCIDTLPAELTSCEQELLRVSPPAELTCAHSAAHLVSFARHIADIIAHPTRRVEVDGHVFHAILGVVVYHRESRGTFGTALWAQPEAESDSWLVEFYPYDTPILSFPSTDLWHTTIRQGFIREALERAGNLGETWAEWAWMLIRERLIDPIDLRRLRSRIRGSLDLDLPTLRLMRRLRAFGGWDYPLTVRGYNATRGDVDFVNALHQSSLLLAFLGWWLFVPDSGEGRSCEPVARLMRWCRERGLKPKQWKLLAAPEAPLLPAFRSFMREFMGNPHRDPGADFLGVITLLNPSKGIDPDVWRSILSIIGTRSSAVESYAEALAPLGETLRHIVRLLEAGKAPLKREQRLAELHEICAWIADQNVGTLLPQQRRRGWELLVRKARQHAKQRMRALNIEAQRWSVPIPSVTHGGFTAVPLTCGIELWEESVAMRHCADLYGERCMSGTTLIISVRTVEGKRKATLAFVRREDEWNLAHAAGPANRHLGKQYDAIIDAILSELNRDISERPWRSEQDLHSIVPLANFHDIGDWITSTMSSLGSSALIPGSEAA